MENSNPITLIEGNNKQCIRRVSAVTGVDYKSGAYCVNVTGKNPHDAVSFQLSNEAIVQIEKNAQYPDMEAIEVSLEMVFCALLAGGKFTGTFGSK